MGIAQIKYAFNHKKQLKQNLFVPYIMAGDGGLDILEERISFLKDCGVAAIELGIPFSDPVADGPTIQEAGQRALKNGTTLSNVLETFKNFKKKPEIPIIIMTYLNPIFSYGIESFAAMCDEVGVDGIIIPDLPLEEEHLVKDAFKKYDIAFIRLAALTSPKERLDQLAKLSEGFLYAVAVKGTTGVQVTHDKNIKSYLEDLTKQSTVPVLAGFGISNSQQAQELGSFCDGVIVGSKLVELLHEDKHDEVRTLIEDSL